MAVEAYSAERLAERLDVPLSTVRHWRTTGNGPPGRKVGRYIRYLSCEVDAWLLSRPVRGHVGVHEHCFGSIGRQSGATARANAAQAAVQQESVTTRVTCTACGQSVEHNTDDASLPAGWITRDNKTLCVACSYVS